MIHALLFAASLALADLPPGPAPEPDPAPATTTEPAPAVAPEGQDVGPLDTPPAGPPPPAADVPAIAREIGSGLRCPVCQGLSVADSGSSAAVLMLHRIQELVAQGYTRAQIEDYFIGRYGEWVLLAPRAAGFNQIVWIGPLLAFVIGLGASLAFLRRGEDAVVSPPTQPNTTADDYARRILSEADDD